MIEPIKCFKTSDGKYFETQIEAEAHERFIALLPAVEMWYNEEQEHATYLYPYYSKAGAESFSKWLCQNYNITVTETTEHRRMKELPDIQKENQPLPNKPWWHRFKP